MRFALVVLLLFVVVLSVRGRNSSSNDVDRLVDQVPRRRNAQPDDIVDSFESDQSNTSDQDSEDVVEATPSMWTWEPEFNDAGCNYWSSSAPEADTTADYFWSGTPNYVAGLDGDIIGTSDVIVMTQYGRVRGRRVDGVAEAGQYSSCILK